ncbi:MAG TPA: prepilin peptidase [Kofleriaceae bacterium]|nr:prepilin peptidase [Kofleriaceae bacterium]
MPPAEVIEQFALSPGGYAFAFLLGLLWGSFANVCIYRMPPTDEHPRGRSVVHPGSSCGACGAPVRWYDNLPIVSYLLLRGRCRDCGAGFSPRYLLVEAATGMLFVAMYHHAVGLAYMDHPIDERLIRAGIMCAFAFVMVVIAMIDIDHQLILNKVTYPAIPIFYGLGLLLPERHWSDGLIGAAVGYGLIRLVADGYYYLTGRDGMGYGDGKLLAIVGALFGWQAVIVSLFAGSLLGTVIATPLAIIDRTRNRQQRAERDHPAEAAPPPSSETGDGPEDEADVPLRHATLPFGPYLAAGALAYVLVQPWLEVRFALLWGGG